jgi:DNA-binding response OmpR family regulator
MSQYCQNCGALNTADQIRCSGCMSVLQKEDSQESQIPLPPWSHTTNIIETPHSSNDLLQTSNQPQHIPSQQASLIPRSRVSHQPSSSPIQSTEVLQSINPQHLKQNIALNANQESLASPSSQSTSSNMADINSYSKASNPAHSTSNKLSSNDNEYLIKLPSNQSRIPKRSTAHSLWSQQAEEVNYVNNQSPQLASHTTYNTLKGYKEHNTFADNNENLQIINRAVAKVSDPFNAIPATTEMNYPYSQSQHISQPVPHSQHDRSSTASITLGDIETPSRTLAPERLAQLYETPQVFLFGGIESLDQTVIANQGLWDRTQELLSLCEPLITDQVNEASIFIAFELPPRSWLQALHDLRPDGEVLVWLSQWPEGKTGLQLNEGKTSAFFYGEEGLIELAVTLYRLAPFSLENIIQNDWWSQVRLRSCLVELEHFQRLLSQAQIDTYLVTLFAQRMRRWARVSREPLWTQIAEASHHLSNHLSQTGNLEQLQAAQEVLTLSEDLLKYELLKRSKAVANLKIACLSQLRIDHPQLDDLLSAFGAQITWFKHPQALLNKVNSEHFHWCFLSEYAGPWDGFDLVQEVKARAQHIQVAVSVLSRRTHSLARAQHLSVDLLLYPNEAISDQVIALNQVFNKKLKAKQGSQDIYHRMNAIQNAQKSQGLPQRTGLLLLQTEGKPWLPMWLAQIEKYRKMCMPKSLSAVLLDDITIAFPLALDQDDPVRDFCDLIKVEVYDELVSGCILNQGRRAPEGILSDVWLRLQWAQQHKMLLSIGWWKSERNYERQLNVHGAQILIVDSDPTSLDLLRFFCEKSGLMVSVLQDGQAAIDLLNKLQYPPQLIIAECMLPYINGFKVLEAAQKLETGKPRTILCSAIKRDELIEKAFAMGACDFVYKPFNMTEVMARIMHALS